jgi:hypothetical protein
LRKIIFHYHLFKNAGTSIDELLKANFPRHWVSREFNADQQNANISQVEQWILQEKNAVAFSSHTAMLPPPDLKDIKIFPIIFVRHPIDRIASAYNFEKNQGGDNFGSVLARHTTLAGYIEVLLSFRHSSQCRNFQINRLAQMVRGAGGDQTALALQALETLPFIGLVGEFDESIKRLSTWLSPHFPEFRPIVVAKNVNRDRTVSLEQKLEQIRVSIGDACYARLVEANGGDLALFNEVKTRFNTIG